MYLIVIDPPAGIVTPVSVQAAGSAVKFAAHKLAGAGTTPAVPVITTDDNAEETEANPGSLKTASPKFTFPVKGPLTAETVTVKAHGGVPAIVAC